MPRILWPALGAALLASPAAAHQPATTTADAVVERFFDALSAQDAEALTGVLAETVVTRLPFGVNGAVAEEALARYEGREATVAYFAGVSAYLSDIAFVETVTTMGADGRTVFVENLGDMTFADGRPYQNRYVWRFTVDDGAITALTEYANPVAAAIAFGLPVGPEAADAPEE